MGTQWSLRCPTRGDACAIATKDAPATVLKSQTLNAKITLAASISLPKQRYVEALSSVGDKVVIFSRIYWRARRDSNADQVFSFGIDEMTERASTLVEAFEHPAF